VLPQAKECSPQAQMTRQLSYGDPADKLWSIFAKITEKCKRTKKGLINFIACFNFKILLRSDKSRLIQKFQ
jgi:hypothetical protein